VRQGARLKVASKYIKSAREHFAAKGVHIDLIKLYGSMELAPLAGLADAIVDLVSTGSTLKANKLVAVEDIMNISSRLVVNQAALKVKREPCNRLSVPFAAVERVIRWSPSNACTVDADFGKRLDALLAFRSGGAGRRHRADRRRHPAPSKQRGDAAVLEYTGASTA
jgi:ATP phosphoribosyltransferase